MKKFKEKKKLGQNFLINKTIINDIVSNIKIKKNDIILEIGPGTGALTELLEKKAKEIHLVEIDTALINILKQKFKTSKKIHFYNQNILKFNIDNISKKKIRIIGNIPYKISTELIFYLINYKKNIKDIHIMLQKEIVDRITAQISTKNYCRLSIMSQCNYNTSKIIENILPSSFKPKPKVHSVFIKLIPKNNKIKNYNAFQEIVKEAFCQRRKKIITLLKKLNIRTKKINPENRPENLSINEYITLSNNYKKIES